MAFGRVPWVVGGGAEIEPEEARILAQAATGSVGGVTDIDHLFVQPLAVPGGAVRISTGSFTAPSNFAGTAGQSYIGRGISETQVTVPPTGSGGGRTDLLIARIVDPQYTGSAPSDPNDYDYCFPSLLQGVSASVIATPSAARAYLKAQGITGAPLAGITMPASTATVGGGGGNGTIKDLRQLAQPKRERHLFAHAMVTGDPDIFLSSSDPAGEQWPNVYGWDVEIPSWATRVKMIATWNGVFVPFGTNPSGAVRARIGADAAPVKITSQEVGFNFPTDTASQRVILQVADDVAVPASVRGTTMTAHLRGRYFAGGGTMTGANRMKLDAYGSISLDLQFEQVAADFGG